MRRRIVRLSTAVTLVAIVLFGLPLAIGLSRYFFIDELRRLQDLTSGVAVAVSGDQGLRQLPRNAGADPNIQFAVYDLAGVRITGEVSPAGYQTLLAGALTGLRGSGRLAGRSAVAVPVTDGNTIVGAVLATEANGALYLRIAITWTVMLTLAAGALTVSWLVGRRQAAALTRPLEQLAEVAERLGDGNFGVHTTPVGITEIDSVNRSLNRTAVRLRALLDRERTYTADASHQLRTPLTGLRLQLEAALNDSQADPRTAIREALTTADRLERTITDLLALARDASRIGDPVNFDAVADDIEQRWHGRLAAQGRPLRLTTTALTGPSRASTAAVTQILDVLLDNAYRHGDGAVQLTVRAAHGAVAIDVTNDGPPITDAAETLFQRRSAQASGHGIGLALAQTLANAEGGRLNLTAPTPTFTLLLPQQPE